MLNTLEIYVVRPNETTKTITTIDVDVPQRRERQSWCSLM
jgi:hypothetical protein